MELDRLKYTKIQIILEIIGLLMIVGMFLYVIIKWVQLPNRIPGHYNSRGEIDRWGSKYEIIALPVIGGLLYGMLTLISFFPSAWNVPTPVDERMIGTVYRCTRSLLIVMKLEMLGMFVYIAGFMANAKALPSEFLPISMIVIFGSLVIYILRIYRLARRKTTKEI